MTRLALADRDGHGWVSGSWDRRQSGMHTIDPGAAFIFGGAMTFGGKGIGRWAKNFSSRSSPRLGKSFFQFWENV